MTVKSEGYYKFRYWLVHSIESSTSGLVQLYQAVFQVSVELDYINSRRGFIQLRLHEETDTVINWELRFCVFAECVYLGYQLKVVIIVLYLSLLIHVCVNVAVGAELHGGGLPLLIPNV